MQRISSLLFILLFLFACQPAKKIISTNNVNPYTYTTNKTATGTHGAVASAHPLASEVGVAIMRQVGNAFDAAIAVQLTLAVVYPAAGNIGGGGFMVARQSNGGLLTLDYREMAPGAATRDMYLDEKGAVIPNKSIN